MGYVIAIAGKGGTGKTTTAALIIRLLREKKSVSILAVDADPDSNLAELLGLEPKQTIGSILDDIATKPNQIPSGMPKDRFIEYQVQTAILEGDGFDLLTMGKPEGPGCYCYVNNVLRNLMLKLVKDYDYIIIDNEAGLEHLSRRTTRVVDVLVVVSDATPVGLRAAGRISDLARELELKTKKKLLLINRFDQKAMALAMALPNGRQTMSSCPIGSQTMVLRPMGLPIGRQTMVFRPIEDDKIKGLDLDFIGNIPTDEEITKISLNGNSLMELNSNVASIRAFRKIQGKIWPESL